MITKHHPRPSRRSSSSFSFVALTFWLLLLLWLDGTAAQFVDVERLAERHDPTWWDRWAGRRPLLPFTQCNFRLLSVFYNGNGFYGILDRELYRDDSRFILAQAGVYRGPDGIREYIEFANSRFSPYLSDGPTGQPEVFFRGYNGRTGQCEFTMTYVGRYTTDPDTTAHREERRIAMMFKLHLAYQAGYVYQINLFLAEGFLDLFFGVWLQSQRSRDYVCEVLHGPACGEPEEYPNGGSCEASMAALPLVDDPQTRTVIGNSQGCRFVHAVLAQTNPLHCAHIALEPTVDAKGSIKCQDSSLAAEVVWQPSDLFDGFDTWLFENRCWRARIDPDLGYSD